MSAIPPGCADVRDDLDVYALGALDADAARRVAEHVAACAGCRRLLDDARESAAALALSVPVSSAGPAARARVLARAAADARPAVLRRSSSTSRWWLAAAAVLVAALAGVSAWAAIAQRRVNDLESDRTAARVSATAQASDLAAQRAMLDVIAQPDVRVVSLYGRDTAADASANYVWSPARNAGVMLADALPQLAPGQTYQAWVVYETAWESAGTFPVDASGAGTLLVSGHDEAGSGPPSWYCVTIEPAGGSEKRTGPIVLTSLTR
jgi:anti-sigma-K factor RskA